MKNERNPIIHTVHVLLHKLQIFGHTIGDIKNEMKLISVTRDLRPPNAHSILPWPCCVARRERHALARWAAWQQTRMEANELV